MMKEEKFIGGRKTKGGEYNQFARNFFFVKDVYTETRTMVNESLIPWKKKKQWSLMNFCYVRVFVKFPTDWIFHAAELHLSKWNFNEREG